MAYRKPSYEDVEQEVREEFEDKIQAEFKDLGGGPGYEDVIQNERTGRML